MMQSVLTRSIPIGFWIGVLLVAGCAGSLRPPYVFNEIMVHNKTGVTLRQVRIRQVERDRVFECDTVVSQAICTDRFRPRPYRGSPVEVSWSTGGATRKIEVFVAKVPDFLDPGRPVRGVLVIDRAGRLEAFFEQDANDLD